MLTPRGPRQLRCSRIDINDQRRSNTQKNDSFSTQFRKFYRDRMQLNQIQKKNPDSLQDRLIQLYKENLVIEKINFCVSTRETLNSSNSTQRKRFVNQRLSQTFHECQQINNKPPMLGNLLSICPKSIQTRKVEKNKIYIRNNAKTLFLDALIFQQDTEEL